MRPARVHILGASGSGTTSLGRALASALASQAFDTDDLYWQPTDPPFRMARPVADRLALAEALFAPRRDWVLSGSCLGWGDPLIPRFTLVIFLSLDPATRLERLRAREALRYGAAIAPGGAMRAGFEAFMGWAAGYDDPAFDGRNLARHQAWLADLPCPVVRLNSAVPPQALLAASLLALDAPRTAP